ncbi:1,4-alpha-glucan branching protein domain-containing protein [Halalkalibacter nanhaiisediminis]|uniref:1,4-alpha-glucan branching enzyme n=1 Tax=Halalkalibacter nanhaiisediminis TaxID=688079 RepID=A0A562QM49_9BACI|nr:1,4-alpha-glucan branching protein domain-containing protein [Halalkalibacter nanhaiisediminis]TWI57809.1 1,4-alpha-glucan branching enzyme [Halalkalibacter nanhaiisediminis]
MLKEGYYSLVLHAHLPYVRHEEEGRLEERWLFEAMTESYLPLLWELEEADVSDAVTISFSPPVMEMLADPVIQRRYHTHLLKTEELLIKEEARAKGDHKEEKLISFYRQRFQKIKNYYLKWDKNILKGFRDLYEKGIIRCMTSAATHAFLPFVKTKAGIRSQVVEAIQCFERHFGTKPKGFWLPECAFAPGIDRILVEEGIVYTFVDEHALLHADPIPSKKSGAPIYSPHGLILFPRHTDLSSKVWSSTLGYPGDVDYREFYRDIAYEREESYILPYIHHEGIRIDTGIKHKRITGQVEEKDCYVREWAEGKVLGHADDYIYAIEQEVMQHGNQCYPPYLMVTPFDAELFGHWWFEGPEWIGQVLKKGQGRISFITPESYVDRHYQDFDTAHVSFTTWGRAGYGHVWVNESNQWLYRHHHRMELDLAATVALFAKPTELERRAIKQMVREWMLAISSDWAFIIDGGSAVQYAEERFATHLSRFDDIKAKLERKTIQEEWITELEQSYPFLEDINEQLFFSAHDSYVQSKTIPSVSKTKRSILMLSWEFPPMIVGGLARHVFDLSRALVQDGHEVHVITSHVEGYPNYEINQGVHVHRVQGLQPSAPNFFDWVGSLNLAMTKHGVQLTRKQSFDVIHAHDWLVSVAAKALKHALSVPLIATIHATEHGRNEGIHNDLQYEINQKEWELTYEADKVIVCSDYMKNEVQSIFSLPENKLAVIPNGVDLTLIQPKETIPTHPENDVFTVFSVGRMVKEKGYQTLIDACAILKERDAKVRFVIAGKGPMLDSYRRQVEERQLQAYVTFLGFISDKDRNDWFSRCDATIFPSYYEPFGIVALEGMAAGKVTIVSDTGGLAGIIQHEENGLKIIPGDEWSLFTQVMYACTHPIERERLASKGLEDVKSKFDWSTIAKQTEVEIDKCYQNELQLTI